MTRSLTIGDFPRATFLSVKTLRHYHRVGLLEPADINPATGYRLYTSDQIPVAQVIRRSGTWTCRWKTSARSSVPRTRRPGAN